MPCYMKGILDNVHYYVYNCVADYANYCRSSRRKQL